MTSRLLSLKHKPDEVRTMLSFTDKGQAGCSAMVQTSWFKNQDTVA